MESHERQYRRLNLYFTIFYLIVSSALLFYYGASGQWYLASLAVGGVCLLFLPAILEKAAGWNPVYQLRFFIGLFLFFSYVVGLVMQAYQDVPYYDKAIHLLSGSFGILLGVLLFYICKPSRAICKGDFPLSALFSFSFSLAMAGLWEIGEYLVGLFFPCDPQRVAATGVSDTMQDMILCLIGTSLALPALSRFYRTGKSALLMGSVRAFVEKNPPY